MFAAIARFVTRRRWAVLAVSIPLVLLAVVTGAGRNGRLGLGDYTDYGAPSAESHRAAVAVRTVGGGYVDVLVIYRNDRLQIADPAFRAAVERSLAALPPGIVTETTTYWGNPDPMMVSRDGHATFVALSLAGNDVAERVAAYHRLRNSLSATGVQLAYTGPVPAIDEIAHTAIHEAVRNEVIASLAILVLLLLLFRSPVAAAIPVVLGGVTIALTLGALGIAARFVEIPVFALNAAVTAGLALGVDAGLFMVSRFREELARGRGVDEAVAATVGTAGRTVFFSGVTICGLTTVVVFFPIQAAHVIGLTVALAMGFGVLLSVIGLPALLAALGRRIDMLRLPFPGRRQRVRVGWVRLARSVMRRPVHYLVGVGTVLVLLWVPVFHAVVGLPDQLTLPAHAPVRAATDDLFHDFGFSGVGVIQVVATFPDRLNTSAGDAELSTLTRNLGATPGVVGGLVTAKNGRTAVIYVGHSGVVGDAASRDLVREIRRLPPPPGTQVLVGGPTAFMVDILDLIQARLPWAVLYGAVLMFVPLLIALRSLVLPVKALLMNVLSIGAAFGSLVWIFQDGHLVGLVGGARVGSIDPITPLVMLLLVTALSMDYEYFLLSRMREEYDALGDNTAAVAGGLQRSGPIITATAATVLVVAAVFADSDILFIKQLCIGIFIVVAVDATLVRALLVPAIMRLLGRANWWLPGSARRGGQFHCETTTVTAAAMRGTER
ncbi:MMPL family transporter [Nocardia terpenica]|uniref:SSD domain-containing protein n=1 Tax=Nocardia terpenica TaxID=455432 RepID=A0A164NZY2_9NOCA|nr:MMPL family transporter [Nocardia terpenica]KZM74933.1 hypothetical protein AWN90_23255 [Nocardia terpenica]NQE93403.1 MMPL family transporter [Nocardia terpenica]